MTQRKHNRAYHRYFENYAEREYTDGKGRRKIERVYVGQYYRAALTDGEHRRRKLRIALSAGAAVALYLCAGLTAPVSGARYVAIAFMLALLGLGWLARAVFARLAAPREMEVRVWRESSEQLKNASLAASVALAADALAMAAGILFIPMHSAANWLGVPAVLLAAAAALVPRIIEQHTDYDVLPPKHERPEGSSPIRSYAPD